MVRDTETERDVSSLIRRKPFIGINLITFSHSCCSASFRCFTLMWRFEGGFRDGGCGDDKYDGHPSNILETDRRDTFERGT